MEQITKLKVGGMTCVHCINAVRKSLRKVPGVTVDEVRIGLATIRDGGNDGARERARQAIRDAGYTVEGATDEPAKPDESAKADESE